MLKKAVFLDRDGVLNKLVNGRPPWKSSEISLFKDSSHIIELIKSKFYIPIVVTNQPDAARGKLPYKKIYEINLEICETLKITNYYICPHGFDGECNCRKPKPGMIIKASKDLGIKLERSLLIGDREKDIKAGMSAGCKTIYLSQNDIKMSNFFVNNHSDLIKLLNKIL